MPNTLPFIAPDLVIDPNDPFANIDLVSTRRYGLSLHVDNLVNGNFNATTQELMAVAKDNGASFLQVGIGWPTFEPTVNNYNYAVLDAALNTCQENGWLLLLRLIFIRNGGNNSTDFIAPADLARDQTGAAFNQADVIVASVCSPQFNTRCEAALDALLNHVKASGKAKLLAAVSVTMTQTAEGEYPQSNDYGSGGVGALFGYAEYDKADFRLWCQSRYGSIAAANKAWSTSYGAFSQVDIPVVYAFQPGGSIFNFDSVQKKDFQIFRTHALARYLNRMATKVATISPRINNLAETGNMQDNLSQMRGTLFYRPYLSALFRAVKSNDEPKYPLALSNALCRGAWDKGSANEIYGSGLGGGSYTVDEMINQFTTVFKNGGSFSVYFGPLLAGADNDPVRIQLSKDRIAQTFQGVQRWLATNPAPTTWDATMTVAQRIIAQYGYNTPYDGGGTVRERFYALTQNGTKIVRLLIDTTA